MFMKECPSGKIKPAGFKRISKNLFPDGNADEFTTFAFNLFDANGNGTIEFSEFLMAMSVTVRGDVEEKLDCKKFDQESQCFVVFEKPIQYLIK